jgi:anaerobic selenocysteine-containing dehydrogenase
MTDTVSSATTHFRACTLCEAICGLEIQVAGGQVTTIRGDRADPFSHGHICPKAVALKDIQDDPDRLRLPQRRTAGGWETIGWDEAFAFAAERLLAVRAAHGADSIGSYLGNPVVHNVGLMLGVPGLLSRLRSKNRFSASTVDQQPHQLTALLMYGHQFLIPIPDIDRTRFMLILGANPLASNGSLMTAPDVSGRLRRIRERGGRIVVIDPRRSETAAVADQHHFIRPGTDAALLLALLNTILTEGLDRPGRLAEFLDGYDTVRTLMVPFTAERAAAVTGIDADTIRALARELATSEPAVVYGRMGVSTQAHGTLCQWLIQLLNIVTGNLDRAGGALTNHAAVDGVKGGRPGSYRRWTSRIRGWPEVHGELPAAAMAEEMLTPGDGQIRALITVAGNPALSTPNGRQLEQALAGLDFMVSVDIYRNETTRHAHLILPTASHLETGHYDFVFNQFAVRRVARWSEPLLPKPDGALEDWEVLHRLDAALAAGLGQTPPPAVSPEVQIDIGLRQGPFGAGTTANLSLDVLKAAPHGLDLGPLEPSFPDRLLTPGRRIQCAPQPLVDSLAAVAGPLMTPAPAGLLLIGRRQLRSNNSWMHNSERLVKGKDRCRLFMHPDDLSAHGLTDGQMVELRSRVGAVTVAVSADPDMMPGVVSLPHGWGHDRSGTQIGVAEAHAGVSVNDVTDELLIDPVSGNAAVNGVPVTVKAATAGGQPLLDAAE